MPKDSHLRGRSVLGRSGSYAAGVVVALSCFASRSHAQLDSDGQFPNISLTHGQTLSFHGSNDELALGPGETATFRWTNGKLWMGNGVREVVVRPLSPFRPKLPSPEGMDKLNALFADVPRIRELLSAPDEIPALLTREPVTYEELPALLPAALTPEDRLVRFAAYVAWSWEKESLDRLAKEKFGRESSNVAQAARDCMAFLQTSPLVDAATVRLGTSEHLPSDAPRAVHFRYRVSANGEGRPQFDTVIQLPASETCTGTGTPVPLPSEISWEDAKGLHGLLQACLAHGGSQEIELGSGLIVRPGKEQN